MENLSPHVLKTDEQKHKEWQKVKWGIIIVAPLFSALVITSKVIDERKEKELMTHYVIKNGAAATGVSRTKGSTYWDLDFKYKINGKTYYDSKTLDYSAGDRHSLVDRAFPLALDTLDLSNGYLLVFPEDFKKFHRPFPDSLQWIFHTSH